VRLVLDTNITVSGLLWKGPPHTLLETARQYRDVLLYVSPKLLAELADVLGREKLAIAVAASGQPPETLMQRYLQVARIVVPATVAPVIVADPDDDHVLACALAAQADLIVSGDPDLLNLKSYQHIPIVDPAEALTRLPQR
jgi:putative PIN family toxin of toxin-antitoxin system